jgi:hypothetical protein
MIFSDTLIKTSNHRFQLVWELDEWKLNSKNKIKYENSDEDRFSGYDVQGLMHNLNKVVYLMHKVWTNYNS